MEAPQTLRDLRPQDTGISAARPAAGVGVGPGQLGTRPRRLGASRCPRRRAARRALQRLPPPQAAGSPRCRWMQEVTATEKPFVPPRGSGGGARRPVFTPIGWTRKRHRQTTPRITHAFACGRLLGSAANGGVDPGPARSTAAAPGVTGRLEIVLKGLAATMSLDPGFIDGGSSPVLPAGIAGPHGPRRGPGWGSMPRPSRSTGMERSMASALPHGARVPTLGSRPMPCAGVRPNRLSWTTLQPTSRTPV